MPAVSRGDSVDTVTTNHDCVDATTTDTMSGDVKVNGTGVHRQGDKTVSHPMGAPTCPNHTSGITTGSTTVFANNKGIARVGDLYDDGEEVSVTRADDSANGSISVFAGG
jgi:uncharacterized Zn-binding protein involved in type VI secretion